MLPLPILTLSRSRFHIKQAILALPNLSIKNNVENKVDLSNEEACLNESAEDTKATGEDNSEEEKRRSSFKGVIKEQSLSPESFVYATPTAFNKYEYSLVAATSNATKLNEPTVTYLNQAQSYELRLKTMSTAAATKPLKCQVRLLFHDRRLAYAEADQITEWSNARPGEWMLELDLPLCYGLEDVVNTKINAVGFKWDPSKETGVFLKVNCIGTEFTPKKHGGERGVLFRLQVEVEDEAKACVLQVFKLKGADRKHKQDREKIGKRPLSEQTKLAPSRDVTVLTSELATNSPYFATPLITSRPNSPPAESPTPSLKYRDESPMRRSSSSEKDNNNAAAVDNAKESISDSTPLPTTAAPEHVTAWLSRNRYGAQVANFRNYNGRDMLRLMREEVIALCGLADGIRLFNDLHMVRVAPRTTFYVAAKKQQEYNALFLEELTVDELVKRLSEFVAGIEANKVKVFMMGPRGILVRVTDDVVANVKPESVFQFELRQNNAEVVLDNVTSRLEASLESNTSTNSN